MPKFKVNIPNSVIDEIEYYVARIADDSVDNAIEWYQAIEQKIYTLDEFPARCPIADENQFYDIEIRHLIFGDYRIIFRIEDMTVQILHVKHGSQDRKPF